MFDEFCIIDLINDEYVNKRDQSTAYFNICQKFQLNSPSIETINEWFEKFSFELVNEMDKNCYDLLKLVENKYSTLKNTICLHQFKLDQTFSLENPRFVFDVDKKSDQLVLFDSFHRKEKHLPIKSNFSTTFESTSQVDIYLLFNNYCFMRLAKSDPILNYTRLSNLLLLKTDHSSNECQILSQKMVNNILRGKRSIIFDQKNWNEFVILGNAMELTDFLSVTSGFIENDQIQIDYGIETRIDEATFCIGLKNGLLIGFRFLQEEDQTSLIYCEKKLNIRKYVMALGKNSDLRIDYDLDSSMQSLSFYFTSYSWADNVCYVTKQTSQQQWDILAFNIETQKSFIVTTFCQQIYDLHVDNDDVLSVFSKDGVYRQSMRKPESLRNLTWFKVCQMKMTNNQNFYEKALKELPLNCELQPFNIE